MYLDIFWPEYVCVDILGSWMDSREVDYGAEVV